MSFPRRGPAIILAFLFIFNTTPVGKACGPFSVQPVFVFTKSPDLPFAEFTRGKIGIVRPSFGRKTLIIAYRYLNGGSFSEEEQKSLVEALQGRAPEENGSAALKTWVAARKALLKENEELPEIYTQKQRESYDFFPNCTGNAFEVAAATLKDRMSSYGPEDGNVREWAAAQDAVFQNCSGSAGMPAELRAPSPLWLRRDRDYQIAAAHFYSLNFDEARRRFETIAADTESPWQETSQYLVARTLVRQASLTEGEAVKRELYEKAEVDLQNLLGRTGKFRNAAQKLLALVKYRLRPQERVRELAGILANQGGNENLRQDLIDYVWLLDKFETRVLAEEKKRQEALKPPEVVEKPQTVPLSQEAAAKYEAIQKGEILQLGISLKKPDGSPDYSSYVSAEIDYRASESEILQAFEAKVGRRLSDDETKDLRERHEQALKYRQWLISPNRKWDQGGLSEYEGCYDDECDKLTLDLIPDFLRADDLSDWIFTLQTKDPAAYDHALARWHSTDSWAWLVAALIKAETSSRNLDALMRDAERAGHDAREFPTVAFELVRLRIALNKKESARKLIDEVISNTAEVLPVSALNEFVAQRARLAENTSEFLKYSQRKPVAFYDYGRFGSLRELMGIGKASWDAEYADQPKNDYEQEVEERYKTLLEWDDRFAFDDQTVDILNWRFPLRSLIDAAHDRAVPVYLQRELILAAWTRAILLQRDELATRIAPEVIRLAPEMTTIFGPYLQARTTKERHYAALFVLLKFPNLSPFVTSGIPAFNTAEQLDYYFESAWWCSLPATEYTREGEEIPRRVTRPGFLNVQELDEAERERAQLTSIGDGRSYLANQVLEWARVSPADPRVPEALFIAARANENYKYGCGGWEDNTETQQKIDTMLRQQYPTSPWIAKLPQ